MDAGGKYFDMGTPMHIDCTLYKTCQDCQEGLEILIPLFEHSDIGAGNMSATFSWSQAGPENLDFKVSVVHSHWSRNDEARLSLVESFIVLLRQLSYAIKNQLGHPKPPTRGFGTQRPNGSLLALIPRI